MTVSAAQITVSTTAVELTTPEADGSQRPGSQFLIQAPSAAILYIGPASVTAATGFPIAAGVTMPLVELDPGERVYGILASGTGTAFVFRSGV